MLRALQGKGRGRGRGIAVHNIADAGVASGLCQRDGSQGTNSRQSAVPKQGVLRPHLCGLLLRRELQIARGLGAAHGDGAATRARGGAHQGNRTRRRGIPSPLQRYHRSLGALAPT